ncbi:Protein KTI12 like [Pseudolycoriella hygida]|uniref:Protein KTI12 homolog n=1 Tax=Pseudolycoriella hygida TaxID=35572 RepID=A0A9Q0RXC7_9DIPT|nr:Protein KTI12 like [Pseudolycoriella hygida]
MPLIIISGLPSSGKSTRAQELHTFFTSQGKVVKIVTENVAIPKAGFQKNEYFADSQKEKIVRADLKSEALRLLNKDDVVILDAGNYIKGYRYELYCATKSARTSQCTIYCGIPKDTAWQFNCKRSKTEQNFGGTDDELDNSDIVYTKEIFDALCLRFEEPHGNSRWDSPLFTIFPEDEISFDEVYKALFESALPPPNKSTQNAPLSSTNYLFELDKLTQDVINTVIASRKIGVLGAVKYKNNLTINVPSDMNASQLNRLRRQFLNYNKLHTSTGSNLDSAAQLFVQFLNSNFNK